MFNGIIKNTGKVSKIYKKNDNCYLEISTKMKFTKSEIGSSISCFFSVKLYFPFLKIAYHS